MHTSPQPLTIVRSSSACIPVNRIYRTARLLYKSEHIPLSRGTTMIFCSDSAIRKLNARFRKIDRATDVLSFPFGDDDLLGEIYISPGRASVQAQESGCTCPEEILRLFIHGFYHLLGYDHKTVEDFKEMERKEENVFKRIMDYQKRKSINRIPSSSVSPARTSLKN